MLAGPDTDLYVGTGRLCDRVSAMPMYGDLLFRDCPWCRVKLAAMNGEWNRVIRAANGDIRTWGLMSCPRCAAVVAIEVAMNNASPGSGVAPQIEVGFVRQVPEAHEQRFVVHHLPQDVAGFFSDALVVLDAGVPDAAAVQLRRTLEAAVAKKGIDSSRLVEGIRKLIEQGAVTKDFGDVLHYVRSLGNVGAHYTDEKLSRDDVERAARFTAQLLRNLFEVPGELALLASLVESEVDPRQD